MDIFSILFGLFEEKDREKILKIIGILFQYLFNISVPIIVLCIQCKDIEKVGEEQRKAAIFEFW